MPEIIKIPSNWSVVKMHTPESPLWWVGWHDLTLQFHPKEGFETEKAAMRRCRELNRLQEVSYEAGKPV